MDEAELLEAIVATPDDDVPRLVYADWLMQRGDPRGELIALQCALAAADACDEPLAHEAQAIDRVAQLLAEHGEAWTAALRELAPTAALTFRRGFVEHIIEGTRVPVLEAAGPVRAAAPVLRSFALTTTCDPPWFALPLELFTALELLEPEYLTVHELPILPRLRRFQLTNALLDSEALAWLLAIPARLEHVGVFVAPYGARIVEGPAIVRQLAERQRDARSVLLGGFALEDPAPLAALPIEQLALHDCGLAAPALLALVERLPQLHTLELFDTRGSLQGLALDALLAAAPRLRRLAIRGSTAITSSDAVALARSPHARALRRLDLSHCQLEASGAAALAESEHLRDLVRLELEGNPIAPEARARAEDAVTRTRYAAPVPGYPRALLDELERNHKIAAIKTYRRLTGAGLAAAKCAVERIVDELGTLPEVPRGAVARWVRC